MASYTIQKGDTLSRIAKANNTTVDAIAKANGISDPNKIRAGATLNIPGQATSSSSGVSNVSSSSGRKNDNYGTGDYGNKYTGSNTNAGYANMVNAPGSAGYERGTFQVPVRNADREIIGYETREGILPLGTSFTSQGAIADTYTGDKETNGIFSKAKGREYGQLHHVSGYNGMGYRDAKGNYYTADGALLREDAHFYEPGAKISANGMYQDRGNGWERANYGMTVVQNADGTSSGFYVPSTSYGHYPGQRTVFETGGGYGSSAGTENLRNLFSTGVENSGGDNSPLNPMLDVLDDILGRTNKTTPSQSENTDTTTTTPTAQDVNDAMRLVEWAYRNDLQPEWEDYTRGNRNF